MRCDQPPGGPGAAKRAPGAWGGDPAKYSSKFLWQPDRQVLTPHRMGSLLWQRPREVMPGFVPNTFLLGGGASSLEGKCSCYGFFYSLSKLETAYSNGPKVIHQTSHIEVCNVVLVSTA